MFGSTGSLQLFVEGRAFLPGDVVHGFVVCDSWQSSVRLIDIEIEGKEVVHYWKEEQVLDVERIERERRESQGHHHGHCHGHHHDRGDRPHHHHPSASGTDLPTKTVRTRESLHHTAFKVQYPFPIGYNPDSRQYEAQFSLRLPESLHPTFHHTQNSGNLISLSITYTLTARLRRSTSFFSAPAATQELHVLTSALPQLPARLQTHQASQRMRTCCFGKGNAAASVDVAPAYAAGGVIQPAGLHLRNQSSLEFTGMKVQLQHLLRVPSLAMSGEQVLTHASTSFSHPLGASEAAHQPLLLPAVQVPPGVQPVVSATLFDSHYQLKVVLETGGCCASNLKIAVPLTLVDQRRLEAARAGMGPAAAAWALEPPWGPAADAPGMRIPVAPPIIPPPPSKSTPSPAAPPPTPSAPPGPYIPPPPAQPPPAQPPPAYAPSSSSAPSTSTTPAAPTAPALTPSGPPLAPMPIPPEEYLCPITHELMKDPVAAPDGYFYDRAALAEWLSVNCTSPMTRAPMGLKECQPNVVLRGAIERWLSNNPGYCES